MGRHHRHGAVPSYQDLFNVWTVDAVSNESGISGDPGADVVKGHSPLQLLLVRGHRAPRLHRHRQGGVVRGRGPAADLVVVIANSTKYGGAGYSGLRPRDTRSPACRPSPPTTRLSSMIAAHEIGHSVGLLEDEYTYASTAPGRAASRTAPTPPRPPPAQLVEKRTKWYRWLGRATRRAPRSSTYERRAYYPYGIYRPTSTSIMRDCSRPDFNLPGREAMIAGFYRAGDALSTTLDTNTAIGRGKRMTGQPGRRCHRPRPDGAALVRRRARDPATARRDLRDSRADRPTRRSASHAERLGDRPHRRHP